MKNRQVRGRVLDRCRLKLRSRNRRTADRRDRQNVGCNGGSCKLGVCGTKSLQLERHALAFFYRSGILRPLAFSRFFATALFRAFSRWEHEKLWAGNAAAPE